MSTTVVTGTLSTISFSTQNSEYTFTWIAGQRYGRLVAESGTYAGTVTEGLIVEWVRDTCWPGERVHIEDEDGRLMFESTPVQSCGRF
jgi:hypothetical protein